MDELEKLYNGLSERKLYTKSFDEFKTQYFDNPDNQAKLFKGLSDRKLYTKSQDEFTNKYFLKKKDEFDSTSQNQELDLLPTQETTKFPLGTPGKEISDEAPPIAQQFSKEYEKTPIEKYSEATNLVDEDKSKAREKADNLILSGDLYDKVRNFKDLVVSLTSRRGAYPDKEGEITHTYFEHKQAQALKKIRKDKGDESQANIDHVAVDLSYKEQSDKIKEGKITNYLETLSDEEKKQLEIDKVESYQTLEKSAKLKFIERDLDLKKWDDIERKLQGNKELIDRMKAEGKPIPNALIKLHNDKITVLKNIREKNKDFKEDLLENIDERIDVAEALDLIKREYGFWDNMKATTGLSFGRAYAGIVGATSYFKNIEASITGSAYDKVLAEKYLKEGIEVTEINRQAEEMYAKNMRYNEIENFKDLGYFMAQETLNQTATITQLMAPLPSFAGITALGVEGAGEKYTTMKMDERRDLSPESYSLFQEIAAPLLYGIPEAALGAAPTSIILKRSIGNLQRTLLKQGKAEAYKRFFIDLGFELVTEDLTTVVQNADDYFVLGDKSAVLTRDLDHTTFQTLASMPSILLGGRAIKHAMKPFIGKSDLEQIKDNLIKIERFKEIEASAIDPDIKNDISTQIEALVKSNNTVDLKIAKGLSSIEEGVYTKVRDITIKQAELQIRADKIVKDVGLSKIQKKDLIGGLNDKFKALEETRVKINEGDATYEDLLSSKDVTRLKNKATKELKIENKGKEEYKVTEENVDKKATEIYDKELKDKTDSDIAKPKDTKLEQEKKQTPKETKKSETFTKKGEEVTIKQQNLSKGTQIGYKNIDGSETLGKSPDFDILNEKGEYIGFTEFFPAPAWFKDNIGNNEFKKVVEKNGGKYFVNETTGNQKAFRLDKEYRGKSLPQEIYAQAQEFLREQFGEDTHIISSNQIGISKDANRMFKSLHKKGLAEILFKTPEKKGDIKYGDDVGEHFNGEKNGVIYDGNIYILKPTKPKKLEQEKKVDISKSLQLDKADDFLKGIEDELDNFSKETLGVGIIPTPVIKGAVKAMRGAITATSTAADLLSAGINYLRSTKWYQKLNTKDKRNAEYDLVEDLSNLSKKRKSRIDRSAKAKIRKSTGQTDISKKVVISEKKGLREKLKVEAKAALVGFKKGRKSLTDVKVKLKKVVLKHLEGFINKRELSVILNKIQNVNEETLYDVREEMISYIEDKIDIRQAKIRIRRVKRSLKSASKKGRKTPENIKELARKSTHINEKHLTKEELYEYEKILNEILNSTKGVSLKKYSIVNEEDAYKKLDKLFESSEKARNKELAIEAELEGKGLTTEELEKMLSEDLSEDDVLAMKEVKRKAIRDALENLAVGRSIALKFFVTDNVSKKNKERVNILKKMNPSDLSLVSLKGYVKIVDNILVNENFSSSYNTVSKIKVDSSADNFISRLDKKGYLNVINLVKENDFTTLKDMALITNQMTGSTIDASKFNRESGLFDFSLAYVKTNRAMAELDVEYSKFAKKLSKKHKGIFKPKNIILRELVANLIQGEGKSDFEINKARIDKTIESFKDSYKTKRRLEVLESLYEDIKDVKSQDEALKFIKDKNDGSYEILNFWIKKFDFYKDAFKENTEEVYGERFVEVLKNYLPISTEKSAGEIIIEDKGIRPAYLGGSPVMKQAASTMERAKSKNLPDGYRLSLDFDSNMFKKISEVMWDINSTEAMFDVKNFFDNKKVRKALGKDNTALMVKSIERMVRIQRGLVQYDIDPIGKRALWGAATVKKIAAIQALGTASAYIKQYNGVVVNGMIRLGPQHIDLLFSSIRDISVLKKDKIELVEMFLSTRGDIQGGVQQGYQKATAAEKRAISSYADKINKDFGVKKKVIQNALFYSLRKGDTDAAKGTWLAYYKKYLRKKGYDVSKLDMSEEHLKLEGDKIRKDAASYAIQNVEETQISSDQSRESILYSKEAGSLTKILKDIFLPYSRFVLQAKMRTLIDLANAKRAQRNGDTEALKSSISSILGTMGEQAVFHSVNYFILKPTVHGLANFIKGLFGIDDEEYDWKFKMLQFKSRLVTDLNPLVIGNAMEGLQLEFMNWIDYLGSDDSNEFGSWKEFEKSQKKEGINKKWYKWGDEPGFDVEWRSLGVFESPLKTFESLPDSFSFATQEYPEYEDYYGNMKGLEFSKGQKLFMKFVFLAEVMSSLGLFEADSYRQFKREQQRQLKNPVDIWTKN